MIQFLIKSHFKTMFYLLEIVFNKLMVSWITSYNKRVL